MLQIDHIYEFFFQNIFKDFKIQFFPNGGVPDLKTLNTPFIVFNSKMLDDKKILFYDQEPILDNSLEYINHFNRPNKKGLSDDFIWAQEEKEHRLLLEYLVKINAIDKKWNTKVLNKEELFKQPWFAFKTRIFVTSEISPLVSKINRDNDLYSLYYFFHGFAALDWYRGHYALNYNKSVVKKQKDFITYNRLITKDRSYRIYFISQLAKHNLLDKGLVSFGVSDDGQHWRDELERNNNSKLSDHARQEIWSTLPDLPERLVIDNEYCLGNKSADIVRNLNSILHFTELGLSKNYDAFWHIVTETVFYYDKLHLTEKIFKPIVSKQPFMLLAAPGNLEYLRSYGFKTFDSVIDESYDLIEDNDARVDSVVAQIKWYSELSDNDKLDVMRTLEPIVEYNFHHFYGEFKNIIVNELLTNCKNLFEEIDYKETVDYDTIRKLLLN